MELLVSGLAFVLFLLAVLVLAAPALAVVIALALPVGAVVLLARLINPPLRRAEPAFAPTARATLGGARATGGVGMGVVPDRLRRATPSPQARPGRRGSVAPRPHRTANPLRAMASQFRSGEALFAFDRDLTVVSWNKGVEELTGIPVEEALGRPCWELLRGVDASGNLVCNAGCPGARLASLGSPVKGQRLLIKTAAGTRRAAWLSTIAVPGDESLTLHLLRNGAEIAEEEGGNRNQSAVAVQN
jgi:PAS domain-containing protein